MDIGVNLKPFTLLFVNFSSTFHFLTNMAEIFCDSMINWLYCVKKCWKRFSIQNFLRKLLWGWETSVLWNKLSNQILSARIPLGNSHVGKVSLIKASWYSIFCTSYHFISSIFFMTSIFELFQLFDNFDRPIFKLVRKCW